MAALLALLLALEPAGDWQELLARAERERKPIVVVVRPAACARCDELERATLPHPAIQRRLPNVVFAVRAGEEPHVAFHDRGGTLRARWPITPDTTNFAIILDSVTAVAPHFERALELAGSGAPHDAELEIATGLARLGFTSEARAALERARTGGGAETRQRAIITAAVLDAKERKIDAAVAQLEQVVAEAATPDIRAAAQKELDALRAPRAAAARATPIRILPLGRQIVSGRQMVRTHVASARVHRVVFSLDGREVHRALRPPFSATLDFGDVPARHAIRAVAYDGRGNEIGRDERVVNEGGETFWLRLLSPRDGAAAGAVRVSMSVRVPPARRVLRVVVSWNDAERAVLRNAPWETVVRISGGGIGILRAVAELDDGRTSEDAVLLNALGGADHANVQLVGLPITAVSRTGAVAPEITADRISVREGKKVRRVESIATAAETPLTVGMLIDVSDSMQSTLPDVQEAAIRFLDAILGERDRAFLVTFDTHARLLQPATGDKELLRRQILKIRPDGLTSVHDAMILGLLQFEGVQGRRAMIVFSDGHDLTSRYEPEDVSEMARRANVPVHVIASIEGMPAALTSSTRAPADVPDEAKDVMHVSQLSGGTFHVLDNLADLSGVYARIEAALRAQILAFVRVDPATVEIEWRRVQIDVAGPNLAIYAPEGYYATW